MRNGAASNCSHYKFVQGSYGNFNFNFFEQQGGKIGEKQGVLRSSPIFKRKSAAKLTQESQFHEESTNTHLQMELKARPGPGSMARKPQK